MKRLVQLQLQDGSTILVEAETPESEGDMIRVSTGSHEILNFSNKTFEESIDIVKPVANTIMSKLGDISTQPQQVKVSFGISMDAKAGMFISSAGVGANFNVTLTWNKK